MVTFLPYSHLFEEGGNAISSDVDAAMSFYTKRQYLVAYEMLAKMALSAPDDPTIIVGLAFTLEKMGSFERSVSKWDTFIKLYSDQFNNAFKLRYANSLIEIGNIDEARLILKEVDGAVPDYKEKWKLVEKIVEIDNCSGAGKHSVNSYKMVSVKDRQAGLIVKNTPDILNEYKRLISNHGNYDNMLKHKSIVIVTYGRTGSTLLQGILNTIKGMVVLGENENSFFHLFEFEKTIDRISKRAGTETPSSPFYGASSIDTCALKDTVRKNIATFLDPFRRQENVNCVGFKEVNFEKSIAAIDEYLPFLERNLPSPAFVFLWRDHDEVLNSGWWKDLDQVAAGDLLEEMECKCKTFLGQRENCFELTFEDVTTITGRLKELFNFLGAEFSQDIIDRVAKIPHSYNPENEQMQQLFHQAIEANKS